MSWYCATPEYQIQLPFTGVVGYILWHSDFKILLSFKRVTVVLCHPRIPITVTFQRGSGVYIVALRLQDTLAIQKGYMWHCALHPPPPPRIYQIQLPFKVVVGYILLWHSDYKIHLPFKRVTCGTVPPHTTKYVCLFNRVTPRSSYICDPTSQNESHGYFMRF